MLKITLLLFMGTALLLVACLPLVDRPSQNERSYESMNYQNGKFHNQTSTKVNTTDQNMLRTTIDFMRGNPNRTPIDVIPAVDIAAAESAISDDLRVTWLGHSTCLIAIDGQVILTDPMFSDRASPLSFVGPKRFVTEISLHVRDLPKIDAVLISHDHYDHLDYKTIMDLQGRVDKFYVPLGVGGHLKRWGVASRQIIELDWWEEKSHGPLIFIATPAQHFSGRGLTDRNKTLWASWTIVGTKQRVFFSGDSGYFSGFKKIGETYGPFDITMLESGAYNVAWADIHMMPEETVQAHLDLQGRLLLPIHWAKFNLSVHPWKEPVQRLLKRASIRSVTVTTPQIGESVSLDKNYPQTRWWKLTSHGE